MRIIENSSILFIYAELLKFRPLNCMKARWISTDIFSGIGGDISKAKKGAEAIGDLANAISTSGGFYGHECGFYILN